MDDPYPPILSRLVDDAFERLGRRLAEVAPSLADPTDDWMRSLAGGSPPARYYTHPGAFPMLLLPWWLDESLGGTPDLSFQADVVYSTIAGYYVVRMIDDLMDRERQPDPSVLPALIVLHTEFLAVYQPWFASDDPFWDELASASFASAELASRDATLGDIDHARFLDTSARKTIGARVPLAAVCHRHGRVDRLGPWYELVDRLGAWHQMHNDILGWIRDHDAGRPTYFLSEAARAEPSTSVTDRMVGGGLAWGYAELEAWMEPLLETARSLESPPLVAYLEARRDDIATEWRDIEPSIAALRRLADSLR